MIESAVVKRILLMSPKTRRQTGSLLLSPIGRVKTPAKPQAPEPKAWRPKSGTLPC
jgi:hypothetical protein